MLVQVWKYFYCSFCIYRLFYGRQCYIACDSFSDIIFLDSISTNFSPVFPGPVVVRFCSIMLTSGGKDIKFSLLILLSAEQNIQILTF